MFTITVRDTPERQRQKKLQESKDQLRRILEKAIEDCASFNLDIDFENPIMEIEPCARGFRQYVQHPNAPTKMTLWFYPETTFVS